MKLLLDEGIPWRSAAILREVGHDATHVIDLDMGGATDAAVLAAALADGAVVVTLDSDFHQLLALTGAAQPSVVRIRQEGLSHQTTADWIARVVATVGRNSPKASRSPSTPRPSASANSPWAPGRPKGKIEPRSREGCEGKQRNPTTSRDRQGADQCG